MSSFLLGALIGSLAVLLGYIIGRNFHAYSVGHDLADLRLRLQMCEAEKHALEAERKSNLDLSRRRLDESQAEIARLTELLENYEGRR